MITPINDPNTIVRGYKTEKQTALRADVEEFINSDSNICKISNPGYKNINSFYVSVRRFTEKYGVDAFPIIRHGEIYLIRGKANA